MAQKLEELLRFAKETRRITEEIQRAVNPPKTHSPGSRAVESTGSDRGTANSTPRWSRTDAALLVQALLTLLTLGAVIFAGANYSLARTMGHKQLRAWINIYSVKLVRDFSNATPAAVDITAKNTGQTPALNLEWTFDTNSFFSGERCRLKAEVINPSRGAVGPSQILVNAGIRVNPLLQPCLDDLKNGASVFSVRGTIRYDDIFGEHHFTNFCFRTNKISPQDLTACEEHNDLD